MKDLLETLKKDILLFLSNHELISTAKLVSKEFNKLSRTILQERRQQLQSELKVAESETLDDAMLLFDKIYSKSLSHEEKELIAQGINAYLEEEIKLEYELSEDDIENYSKSHNCKIKQLTSWADFWSKQFDKDKITYLPNNNIFHLCINYSS